MDLEVRGVNWFVSNIKWKFGNGFKILFWENVWVRDTLLKDKYPRLFINSNKKSFYIDHMGSSGVNVWLWNLVWRRHCFKWEKHMLDELMSMLDEILILKDKFDEWFWRGDCTRLLLVRSAY
ncbi:hypothetical protein PHAVU_004G134700, partial [Phaseolus vulgaris]